MNKFRIDCCKSSATNSFTVVSALYASKFYGVWLVTYSFTVVTELYASKC